MKKRKWLWLACALAYPAALGLLTLAERNAPGASIQTFSDAFWYSLVTMSTVGYGDLYPVTTLGRILGGGFILLSLGLLTFLLGLLIRTVTGNMLPSLRLWLARKRYWYIFSCQNSAAYALAKNLVSQEPDCVILFPRRDDQMPPETLPYLTYTGSPESVAARKKENCHICFLDDAEPYSKAVAALKTGHPVACRTTFAPDVCPENLTLFHPYDCCAQRYWQDHGLKPEESTVILVGDGSYAEALLIHSLLLNVYGPERKTDYHIFGNWDNFRRNHHRLTDGMSPDGLYFHEEPWNRDPCLLASAQRIILCQDNQDQNMEILRQLRACFPVTGEVHLLCQAEIPGEILFGTEDSIYTPQLVLQAELNRAARAMHHIYSTSAGTNAPRWEHLTEFQRQSNIAAAGHLLTKIRILLENDSISAITPEACRAAYDRYQSYSPEQKEVCRWIEHQRWMRFHCLYNWQYAPARDNAARLHPLMVPYEALPALEQEKDEYAWELLEKLAQKI